MQSQPFNYQTAFQRNLGLINQEQQECLRTARIVIAGLGGVGGAQANALVRMGVGRFTLADLDTFELTNFNRQLGATMQTIGMRKVEAIRAQILSVNPEADVKLIDEGINPKTIGDFLADADMVLDALDFNCFEERFLLYRECRKLNLWVLNCAPPGFGNTLMLVDPQGMSFEEYFDLNKDASQHPLKLGYGVNPSLSIFRYLDKKLLQLSGPGLRLPCVSPAFFIGAGITAAEVFCFLTGAKTRMKPVPHVYEFDAYLHRYKKAYYWLGMRHPWHRFRRGILSHFLLKKTS